MAVLSKQAIIRRLRKGDLVLSPILDDDQLDSCSVDLRFGTVAKMPRARGLSHVDPRRHTSEASRHEVEVSRRQKLERHEIPFDTEFLLHPGMLALVPTLEWIVIPEDLQGVVTARSSWAREGLNIATATFIGPGYNGIITLELSNLGQIPIALFPGMRLAQIAFLEIGKGFERKPRQSQFGLSFEPQAGNISKGDDAFIIGDELSERRDAPANEH